MTSTNYYHTIPNSHFWGDIGSLITFLSYEFRSDQCKQDLIDFLIIGLNNTKSQGYDILKRPHAEEEEDSAPVPEKCLMGCTYSKSMNQPYPRLCIRCRLPEQTLKSPKPVPPPNKFITEKLPLYP